MSDVRDAAWERLLDWGLREVGGSRQETASRRRTAWWVAAVVVLGLSVVVAVLATRGDDGDEQAAQQPQEVIYRRVTNAEEIAALPADTRFVEGLNLGDDDVEALTRLQHVEGLRLRASDSLPPRLLTDAAIPHLSAFTRLRTLDLIYQLQLTGAGLDVLARLPVLENLRLQCFDLEGDALAFLPGLPALRRLDLSLNHGVRGEAMAAVARCGGLRSLNLYGCSQLSVAMISELTALRQLQELVLSGIGDMWRGDLPGVHVTEQVRASGLRYRRAMQENAGLTDEVFAIVAQLPELRVLRLADGKLSGNGLGALGRLKKLRELDLGDNPDAQFDFTGLPPALEVLGLSFGDPMQRVTDDDVRVLRRRLQDLTTLSCLNCVAITDVAVAELLALPRLRDLDLSYCSKITSTSLELLAHAEQIRTVRLDGLDWVTLAHVEALFAAGITVHCARPKDPAFEAGLQALAERYRDVGRSR